MALYGFKAKKKPWPITCGVGGVGPSAMSILSTLSMDNIRRAILSEEPDFFNRAGIGKRPLKSPHSLQGKLPALWWLYENKRVDDLIIDALINMDILLAKLTAVQALQKDTLQIED